MTKEECKDCEFFFMSIAQEEFCESAHMPIDCISSCPEG